MRWTSGASAASASSSARTTTDDEGLPKPLADGTSITRVIHLRTLHLGPDELLVAANRDEHHARPTAPLDYWPDTPGILAGRDLVAAGTWLAARADGRFAAVTNFRGEAAGTGLRSRQSLAGPNWLDLEWSQATISGEFPCLR